MRADKSTIPTLSLDGNEAITDKDKSNMLNACPRGSHHKATQGAWYILSHVSVDMS